jgi:hypothetical protein
MKRGRARLRWVSQLMKTGTLEWDEQTINACMFPHDPAEVLKIRLPGQAQDDILAWHYERTGLFGVHINLFWRWAKMTDSGLAVAVSPDGSRSLYNEIWSAKVPPKVKIFAWRLSQDGLATDSIRKRRTLVHDATCQLCAREEETSFHETVRCSKAVALRMEMRSLAIVGRGAVFIYKARLAFTPAWING